MPTGNTFLLFVYGTLKRGGCRHGPLAALPFVGEARTLPRYALYDFGEHPGLKPTADVGQAVCGELYEVPTSLLPWLDEVEGAPDWFALAPIELDGVGRQAWAYYHQQDAHGRPLVASGRWDNR